MPQCHPEDCRLGTSLPRRRGERENHYPRIQPDPGWPGIGIVHEDGLRHHQVPCSPRAQGTGLGIVAIRLYGTGGSIGFPMGNTVGAFHIQEGYSGRTEFTFASKPAGVSTG